MLDIGIGFGKYGFLAREYLELWDGRDKHKREDWKRTIDGIEAFEEYINPAIEYIYDTIHIGDASDLLPKLGQYDLILLGDVIEHFDENRGRELLKLCMEKAKNIIIITPGTMTPQKDAFGNPFETHRWQWSRRGFIDILGNCYFLPNVKDHFVIWGEILNRMHG
ncbi:class I SAM-dependent methyltransferase [candidate division KSB1 bacterium]